MLGLDGRKEETGMEKSSHQWWKTVILSIFFLFYHSQKPFTRSITLHESGNEENKKKILIIIHVAFSQEFSSPSWKYELQSLLKLLKFLIFYLVHSPQSRNFLALAHDDGNSEGLCEWDFFILVKFGFNSISLVVYIVVDVNEPSKQIQACELNIKIQNSFGCRITNKTVLYSHYFSIIFSSL